MTSNSAGGVRNLLNKNGLATAIVLIIVIVAVALYTAYALGYLRHNGVPDPATTKLFFIDEDTGDVEIHSAQDCPPLPGKAGKSTVVRAHYYTTSTDDARVLVYLERCTPEVKAAQDALGPHDPITPDMIETRNQGTQVRLPQGNTPWYSVQTPQGQELVTRAVMALDADARKIREVFPK
jgi:hypothetical protein